MSETTDLDTENTDEPVCPFCGHEMQDAYELDLEDGDSCETECDKCERAMKVTGHVRYSYTTTKPEGA